MSGTIRRRLDKLESEFTNSGWPKHTASALYHDGEDQKTAIQEAEASYRAEHGLADDVPVGIIVHHIISPEWATEQRAKGIAI